MQVQKVMTALPLTAAPDTSLDTAQELMDIWSLRHLPVVEPGPEGAPRLVGVVSQGDLWSATGRLPEGVRSMRRPIAVDKVKVLGDLMHTDLVTAAPGEGVPEVAKRVVDHHIRCVPVVEDGRLIGILTVTDILRTFATLCSGRGLCQQIDPTVDRLMSRDPVAVESSATLAQVQEAMARADVRHLPVRSASGDGQELLGIVSDTDVRRALGCGRLPDHPVSEFLTLHPAVASVTTRASDAAAQLVRCRIGSLPVVSHPSEDRSLVGIVTSVDLLRHCAAVLDSPDHPQPWSAAGRG